MEVNKPLISVIVTTYNRSTYLKQTLQSVENQIYKNIEIIVVDDGSDINYAEAICNEFIYCNYFYKKNGGLSSARNYGISKAKGEYIAFLDDDDYWREDKLQKQADILKRNPSICLVHSSALVVDEKGNSTNITIGASYNKVHKRSGNVFWNALGVWVVKSPTPLIRKNVFKSDLMFDESIKVGEDVDFYQRLFFRHKVFYINEPLAFYREYDSAKRLSLQKKKYLGIEKKNYKNFLKMGIRNPLILYRIALRLAFSSYKKHIDFGADKIKNYKLKICLRPFYYLNKLS